MRSASAIDAAASAIEDVARLARAETIASISVPAPVLDVAAVANAFGDDLRLLWRDRSGALRASVGILASVRGRGERRFAIARDGVRALFARVAGVKRPVFGGFAFEPGGADGPLWRGFGDARFEMPEVGYQTDGHSAELFVNVSDMLSTRVRKEALAQLEHRSAMLESATQAVRSAKPIATRNESGRAHYLDLVTRARDLVRSGEFDKLVVARKREIELAESLALPDLLGRVDAAYRDCTLFAVRGDRGVFIAATPERLATVSKGRVETVALAGTVPLEDAATLHSDAKLQLEHRLTAEAIAAALGGADGVSAVNMDDTRICRLRKLVHLETPITARIRQDVHVFDIAAALHPTPAVAGIPTAKACAFVRESEDMARGWYAGLVGWCDESGDGELVVALRAGLLEARAMHLYAGAGIVGDSVPETEWDETSLKLSALETQLGAK